MEPLSKRSGSELVKTLKKKRLNQDSLLPIAEEREKQKNEPTQDIATRPGEVYEAWLAKNAGPAQQDAPLIEELPEELTRNPEPEEVAKDLACQELSLLLPSLNTSKESIMKASDTALNALATGVRGARIIRMIFDAASATESPAAALPFLYLIDRLLKVSHRHSGNDHGLLRATVAALSRLSDIYSGDDRTLSSVRKVLNTWKKLNIDPDRVEEVLSTLVHKEQVNVQPVDKKPVQTAPAKPAPDGFDDFDMQMLQGIVGLPAAPPPQSSQIAQYPSPFISSFESQIGQKARYSGPADHPWSPEGSDVSRRSQR